MRRLSWQLIRAVLGALIGGVALWATLRDIEPRVLGAALSGADPVLAGCALIATLVAVVLLAIRWKVLFRPDYPDVSLWHLLRSMVIAQMLNIASPVRVGELTRLYGISASERIPPARVLATLAVEKALEFAVFGAAALTLIVIVAAPAALVPDRLAWAAMPVMAIAALWGIATLGPALARKAGRIERLPRALGQRLERFADTFAAGVSSTASLPAAARLLGLTAASMLLPASANQMLLYAFGLQLPVWTGLMLLVVLQIGSVPPSLPGRLGIFNYLTVVTLQGVGVDRVTAASYSIALYLIAYVPKLLLGALFLALPAPQPRSVPLA